MDAQPTNIGGVLYERIKVKLVVSNSGENYRPYNFDYFPPERLLSTVESFPSVMWRIGVLIYAM